METLFQEMKRYVGFTEEDSRLLASLLPLALPHLPAMIDDFYGRIQKHPEAMAVFSGPEQIQRLKATLRQWAETALSGPHDEGYFELRSRIGRTHVKVGLKQFYMFTAMNVLRESLQRIVSRGLAGDAPRRNATHAALNRILDLDLAIMLETYREEYVVRVTLIKRQAALERLAAIGEVAASVAHEIRNPLAGISGAVEILRDDLPSDSPRREVIREVLAQIRRLDERVRDLLLYSKNIQLRFDRVDPEDLIRATRSLLSEEPLLRDIRMEVSVPPGIGPHVMDRGGIQEVLVNLIRNAAEAMRGTGEIHISVARRDGGELALSVEDTGPGVPSDRVEEIFRPFVTTRTNGTGLGLAIARRTIEAHGGSLTCEQGTRGGACFIALLPVGTPLP